MARVVSDLREGLDMLEEEDRPRTAPAICGYLLCDLETFPAAFQRAHTPWIEDQTSNPVRAREALNRFEYNRAEPRDEIGTDCGCGCSGRNNHLGRHLDEIRQAALRVREAKTLRLRTNRCRDLAREKVDFLEWMWRTGQRTIDRLALTQHAIDNAKYQCEHLERWLNDIDKTLRGYHARLARGVFQGPRRGQPLSELVRAQVAKSIADVEAAIPECRARVAELQRMVAEDMPALVRDFTGCTREEVA